MTSNAIDAWLDAATRGLKREVAERTRRELRGHYEDAREDYELRGLSSLEADTAALRDLGDAETIRADLRDVHTAPLRWRWAVLSCLAYPVLIIADVASPIAPWIDTLNLNVVLLVAVSYLLWCGRGLLRARTLDEAGRRSVDRAMFVLAFGLISLTFPQVAGHLLGLPTCACTPIVETMPPVEIGLRWVLAGGYIVMGVGHLLLVDVLANLAGTSKRVKSLRFLRWMALPFGYLMIAGAVGDALWLESVLVWFWSFSILFCALNHAAWALVFYYAQRRESADVPMQIA